MDNLIAYEDLPHWVPGRVTLASDRLGWKNVAVRSYHYLGQDVVVPPMRDFLLVGYRQGATSMQRRFDGKWKRDTLGPGAASLLTRAQRAFWNWQEPIDVTHVYLSGRLVLDVASEAMDCMVSKVELQDILRVEDPVMTSTMLAIAAEAEAQGLGGPLYVDSMARALIVHLLRRYAAVKLAETTAPCELSLQQRRAVVEFVEANLAEALDLTALAASVGLTPCRFARQFRRSFGTPPYAYVLSRRLERARALLSVSSLALKQIAVDCGFSDQPHLTRVFRRAFDVTPAEFRRRRG